MASRCRSIEAKRLSTEAKHLFMEFSRPAKARVDGGEAAVVQNERGDRHQR
jgi:hypothetical protein